MKKIFTLLTIVGLIGFSLVSKAQLSYHAGSTTVNGDTSTLLTTTMTVYNNSASSLQVKVARKNTSLAPGHDSYFCWGLSCFPPTTDSSNAFTMAPYDSSALICYAAPNGTFGTDQVNLTVYDVANPTTDKISIDITFDFATGINVFNRPSTAFLSCSQSGLEDYTNFTYSISNFKNGKLLIRNLLGSVVKEIALTDRQGTLMVSTSGLPTGLYMLFLYNNDVPVATKKTVISHR